MHHDLLFRAANYRPLPPTPRHHAHPNAYPTTTSSANPVDWGVHGDDTKPATTSPSPSPLLTAYPRMTYFKRLLTPEGCDPESAAEAAKVLPVHRVHGDRRWLCAGYPRAHGGATKHQEQIHS
ncbi:hypothetical protein MY4038_001416 [Beauveria bassiana]